MADNPLKATLDSIAEEDNEIGGQLLTRLAQKAKWGRNDALLETANSDRITLPTGSGWFESWMAGVEIDILAQATPTGQEGRYTVLTVDSSGDYVTVEVLGGGAPGFTDEDPIQIRLGELIVESVYQFLDPSSHVTDTQGSLWVGEEQARVTYGAVQLSVGDMRFQQLGDPDTGEGYLELDHAPLTEITEASQSYSALDKLRRAMLVDYATVEELDRIGRTVAVVRPPGVSDAIYRALVKALAYAPKGTELCLELVLSAIFPSGGWTIYEDRINVPNTVFILLPTLDPGEDHEGRAFLSSEESQAATSTTTVDVTHTPITVSGVHLDRVALELLMAVLPSADTTPWTYVNEGATEGTIFSITADDELQHDQSSGNALGGHYERTEAELGVASPPNYGAQTILWSISAYIKLGAEPLTVGYPWKLAVTDGSREYALLIGLGAVSLGQTDDTTVQTGTVGPGVGGDWFRVELRRRGDLIDAIFWSRNGGLLQTLSEPVGSFAAAATTKFAFGYWNNSGNQTWTVEWDRVEARAYVPRNWMNLYSATGALSAASVNLTDSSNPFVAGDDGKQVRVYSAENKNDGLWQATFVGAGTLTLAGISGTARLFTPSPSAPEDSYVIVEEPYFRPQDVGKTITISDSGSGSDGDYLVTAWVDDWTVQVDATALVIGFVAESGVTWVFRTSVGDFATESNVTYELVDAASVASKTVTVRQAWPNAAQPLTVDYTAVLSAQLLANETVENEGSGGVEPGIFYPFYLWDVEQWTRDLMDEITAAGVIPEFERDF